VLNAILVALSLPVLAWTGYLATLALLSGRLGRPAAVRPTLHFDVVVPAHDEEAGIAATVESLLRVDYPGALRRILVVADNCHDETAARARASGACVLERRDASRVGKGYALAYAFECSGRDGFADAVAVVDADTRVTPNLLRAFAARIASGASAVQTDYAVANTDASWRTRLMHLAFTLFHTVRSRARERANLSSGLRGNGMAFTSSLLHEVPYQAFSLAEDVEYGIRLGLSGHRVQYAGEAQVFGLMVASERGSRSQRRRWEEGRRSLRLQHAPHLFVEGLRRRSLLLLDLAADLVVPSLTYIALSALVGLSCAAVWFAIGGGAWWALAPWVVALAAFGLYLARGAWLTGVGPRVALDLLWAPVYVVWKVVLSLRSRSSGPQPWVRTARDDEARR
jgi:cellulose synthase/poly-beta-1,6-N-acetylglucosamine synthase-like glycosyltransferase